MKQNKVLLIDNRALHSQKSNFETEKNELIADHNESQSALGRRNQSKIQLKLNEDRTWWTILQDFILAGDEKIIVLETQLLVKDEMIRGLILANSGLSFQLDLARDALVQVRDDLVKKEREIKSTLMSFSPREQQQADIPPGIAGIALTIVVYGINMFGDAMQDLLDPRLRGGSRRCVPRHLIRH